MAYIRDYARISGDPFRFRLPRQLRPSKKIKRFASKVGRGALSIARTVLPAVIPGAAVVGKGLSIAADLGTGTDDSGLSSVPTMTTMPVPEPAPLEDYQPEETMPAAPTYPDWFVQFARSYGLDLGDPVPKRGKLNQAAAPPSTHAAAKRQFRANKRSGQDTRSGSDKRRGKKGFNLGASLGAGASAVGHALPNLIGAFKSGGPAGAMLNMAGSSLGNLAHPLGMKMPGMGGGHRRINPANVKALRRSIRRMEGFEKLVKSVRKSAAGLRGIVAPQHHARTSSRGHRPGCRCVVCKRG